MTLRDINIDLLYISLSHILFLLKLYGMQYNIVNNMHILKKCISKSRKIVMDIKYLYNVNSSEPYLRLIYERQIHRQINSQFYCYIVPS